MRFVARDSVNSPDVLTSKNHNSGKTETQEAIEHYDKWPHLKEKERKSFGFKVYGHNQVKETLTKMFSSKCAYCEIRLADSPMDVEHFRPKNAVFNEQTRKLNKPGYYWLGATWDNLLPSCPDCNRARNHRSHVTGKQIKLGKANRFPLEDEDKRATKPENEQKEMPLLLNPCVDKPEDHLEFREGVLRPMSDDAGPLHEKARTSIEVYALNRPLLIQSRLEVLKHVNLFIGTIRDAIEDEAAASGQAVKQRLRKRIHRRMADLEQISGPEHQFTLMVKQKIEAFKTGN